ncbi:hypothetical protein NA57DRAFT_56631 [Rhizodiscina lignyota]|uniref:Uncharacterized protein n=1 Tax=Rhizodiscina lignyota TaxID=1504668 RepID=A0A9P4IIY3_9PEZI|nr:hypothetical protein NA57DRAFT_56631 [Rhizodiscina lignyota]
MQSFTILSISSFLLLTNFVLADVHGCPGVFHVEASDSSACCVGGTLAPVVVSSCPGWPQCTGPATTSQEHKPLSCATDIPFTASDYSQQVASASSSLKASGTQIRTTITGAGDASAGSTATGAASSTGGSSDSSATSTESSAAAASTNAAYMVAGSAGALGAAVAAAIGML